MKKVQGGVNCSVIGNALGDIWNWQEEMVII